MVSRIRRIVRFCAASAIVLLTIQAATADQITLHQDSSTHVIAQLSGTIPTCESIAPIGFVYSSARGNIIVFSSISSACVGSPPFLPLVPYVSTVDLGALADGDYTL